MKTIQIHRAFVYVYTPSSTFHMNIAVSQPLADAGIYEYAHAHHHGSSLIKLVRVCNVYLCEYPGYYAVIEQLREKLPETSLPELLSDSTFALQLYHFLTNLDTKYPHSLGDIQFLLNTVYTSIFQPGCEYDAEVCVSKLIFWVDQLVLELKAIPTLRLNTQYTDCIQLLVDLANHLQTHKNKHFDYLYLQSVCDAIPPKSTLLMEPRTVWIERYPNLPHQINLILMGLYCIIDNVHAEKLWVS